MLFYDCAGRFWQVILIAFGAYSGSEDYSYMHNLYSHIHQFKANNLKLDTVRVTPSYIECSYILGTVNTVNKRSDSSRCLTPWPNNSYLVHIMVADDCVKECVEVV